MTLTAKINNLECNYAKSSGSRIVYALYPMPLPHDLIDSIASAYEINVAVITGMDWDNDLTPWQAAGVPSGTPDFKGDAKSFLRELQDTVIPRLEELMGIHATERNLIGVSLSGLFTLWQWMTCDTFHDIASLSGSFWYDGFTGWLSQNAVHKNGRAYFLLGNLESKAKVPQFKSIDTDTNEVVNTLKAKGVDVTFESVPGNHYQYTVERLQKALDFLYR